MTRLDRIWTETVREMMEMEKSIIEKVQKLQLTWFGHTNRMQETR
jgi:hypothetical protein